MRVATIVGARPQFIKAAVVSKKLREDNEELIIHTGQHYDYNMSEQFFRELDIPNPDFNLGVSGGSHAQMTGKMMIEIENVLKNIKPDVVLVYGDTNSTLAGALASAKLYIPVCHVEAGGRVHSDTNPEEINRICTDHVSALLLACTQRALDEAQREGLGERTVLVGDPMLDAFLSYSGKRKIDDFKLEELGGSSIPVPRQFYYMTCHREENTNDSNLHEIFLAMNALEYPTIYPVHPRNKQRAIQFKEKYKFSNILLTEPIGYLESICLINNAKAIVTDSGGLQREAFFAKKKCVTILNFRIWPETWNGNRNCLCSANKDEIIKKLSESQIIDDAYQPFGDGHASEKIVKEINSFFARRN